MLTFTCDYNEGAHPRILQRLAETNFDQEPGYGFDRFTESARQKIREACGCPDADVFLLVGGTQTNATVIDALLARYEGVVAAETGHIAIHESGAVEFCGHKVLTIPGHSGKMEPAELEAYLRWYHSDPSKDHIVYPGLVYISFPTEYGTIYTRAEIESIRDICKSYGMKLFIDGARLGYGLAGEGCDVTLPVLASLCDAFYIGGTKVGALCGEAVVFPNGAPPHFFSTVKQHGALLAKGRLLGLQFETLFTDGLYFEISRGAIEKAMQLKAMFKRFGIPLHIDSPTNQQFPILTKEQAEALQDEVGYEIWEELPDGRLVTRFATSWATTQAGIDTLSAIFAKKIKK